MWRISIGLFAGSGVLAGLSIEAAALPQSQIVRWPLLEVAPIILVVVAIGFFILGVLFGIGGIVRWLVGYWWAVQIPLVRWYCRYWPMERIAQVSSVGIEVRDSPGRIRLECSAQFGHINNTVTWSRELAGHGNGGSSIEFPQQAVAFLPEPHEGDTATITIRAKPRIWKGRARSSMQLVTIGVSDHRPTPDIPRSPN